MLRLLLPFAILSLSPLGPGQETADATPRLVFAEAVHGDLGDSVRGSYRVVENRALGAGRELTLDFVILLATGEDPAPDPVFVLAGGPGQAATSVAPWYVDSPLRAARDLVFLDQRGTAGDHELDCDLPAGERNPREELDIRFDPEQFRACLERLAQHADLSQYSTVQAADDLDEVREALGYERINLSGGSYGTRAALVFMRRHGTRVRTAVLNGVAPLAYTNPLFHAREAQRALDRILAECDADPDCHGAYPRLREEFREVLARLEREPAPVVVPDPATGAEVPVLLTRQAFAEVLRVLMYNTPTSRQVPYLIHAAHAGDFSTFAATGLEVGRGLRDAIAEGMLLSVTCAEDLARIDPESIDELTRDTFLGDLRVRSQLAVCEFWPRSPLPEGFGAPVTSPTPTLLLSGTLDPVTPERWGAEAARHLPNSVHLVVPGAHGVGGVCVDAAIAELLRTGSVEGIDTSCAGDLGLPPFRLR